MVLVHDALSECALQIYEVWPKYLLWFSSYLVDMTDRQTDIGKRKNNMSPDPSRGETYLYR